MDFKILSAIARVYIKNRKFFEISFFAEDILQNDSEFH